VKKKIIKCSCKFVFDSLSRCCWIQGQWRHIVLLWKQEQFRAHSSQSRFVQSR